MLNELISGIITITFVALDNMANRLHISVCYSFSLPSRGVNFPDSVCHHISMLINRPNAKRQMFEVLHLCRVKVNSTIMTSRRQLKFTANRPKPRLMRLSHLDNFYDR